MAPSCLRCCFYETTRAAVICSCILLYIHLSVHAHITLTRTRARICARMRMHMHMTHSSAHAQTRMYPGTCGPTTHAHTHPCMNTRACLRTHMRYARTQAHVCTHPHNAHACIRTRTREHACTCTRTRANTRPHIWLRANRLGPYSSSVSCV